MTRYALGIEYDGSRYKGWQRQAGQSTIQQHIEHAISKVADHQVKTVVAGRTDSGVHATHQVVHFDSPVIRESKAWVFGGNTHLPPDIRILWATETAPTFNARRSATSRRYQYIIYNHPIRPGLLFNQISWYFNPLDVDAMQEAAQHWVGEHDFSSFRAAECQSKSPTRNIQTFEVYRSGDLVIFDILANAFLHHMIRNMVGTLMEVGKQLKPVAWAKEVLLARERSAAGITALPNGLYLVNVEYPNHFGLPRNNQVGPWFLIKSLRHELV